jgi:hypothetical protein
VIYNEDLDKRDIALPIASAKRKCKFFTSSNKKGRA